MKIPLLFIGLFLPVCTLCADDNVGFGIGAFPVSQTTVSMWLMRPTPPVTQPVFLVYFSGAAGWHDRPWETQFDGNVKNQERTNYRLVSKNITLYIAISGDRKTAWVQGKKYGLDQANVFLVKNADGGPKGEDITVLGRFDLTNSSELPLSLFLLRKYPELEQKLK